jgi:hypothetical protein
MVLAEELLREETRMMSLKFLIFLIIKISSKKKNI